MNGIEVLARMLAEGSQHILEEVKKRCSSEIPKLDFNPWKRNNNSQKQ